ncbi:MAG: hypothetical protein ACRDGN_11195 [bacterium]
MGGISIKARSDRAGEVIRGDALGDGWAALADARWEDARARFERALEEGETPEALEGLGWSAWWLDDADTRLPRASAPIVSNRRILEDSRGVLRQFQTETGKVELPIEGHLIGARRR